MFESLCLLLSRTITIDDMLMLCSQYKFIIEWEHHYYRFQVGKFTGITQLMTSQLMTSRASKIIPPSIPFFFIS